MLKIPERRQSESDDTSAASVASIMPRFGVALFDNPRDMSEGWACRGDEREPFRFSVAGLENDTLWVTNLDWSEYQAKAQKLSHLRRVDYLRSSLNAIAADLGVRLTGEYAVEGSRELARVLRQAMLIMMAVYPIASPITDFRGDVLADDIRRLLPRPPKASEHTRTPLASAYQAYSVPEWANRYVPESITLTLRLNRLEYAQRIMATQVPDEGWTYVPPENAGSIDISRLLDPTQPSLVEAVVELDNIDPELARLIAFGSQSGNRTAIRKWISQPELAWLSQHAKVRVSSFLLARASRPLSDGLGLPARLTADPLFVASMPVGLVAECHWSAVASTPYNRSSRSNDINVWAVWLRAMDRALSFRLAFEAHQNGLVVAGYGNGSCLVRVPRDALQSVLTFADAHNISYPAFTPLFEEHGML